jgi:hypothetical protein
MWWTPVAAALTPAGATSIPVVVDIFPLHIKGWTFLLKPFFVYGRRTHFGERNSTASGIRKGRG